MKVSFVTAAVAALTALAVAQPNRRDVGCVSGTMKCNPTFLNWFQVCDHTKYVDFECPPGTHCYPNGDYIICNYPSS
ncbi:hypothetical protein H4R35_007250 [Dimargaris xerosporica]|nr:hypothetical protein H4R35_007250 [Dimargaris xerosporica]